jgi:hypothetical protein
MSEHEWEKMNAILKQYIDDQILKSEHHVETLINLKFDSLKEATELARENIDTRLANMNEFRGALSDQSKSLYTRQEHELYKEKVDIQLKEFNEWKARQEGKADQSAVNLALAISLIGLAMGFVSFILGLFRI